MIKYEKYATIKLNITRITMKKCPHYVLDMC